MLCNKAGAPGQTGARMMTAFGEMLTELQAIANLTEADEKLMAGGAGDAEGVWLTVLVG